MRIGIDHEGSLARVALAGTFDFSGRQKIKRVRDELIADERVKTIEFDLSAVTRIDSAALGMLLLVRDAAAVAQKRVSLRCQPGTVRDIIDVARLEARFEEPSAPDGQSQAKPPPA
ncbi:MAG: STAS domain-containing protein [Burkholderiales bacterium]|nr:STAS domain-containing protein [Burkholderiales bacterium]